MSRINLILFLICLAGLSLSAGCENAAQKTGKFTDEEMEQIPLARRADPAAHSDGLVLSVKSETITIGEVVTPVINILEGNVAAGSSWEDFSAQARPVVKDAVISKITDILLYQEARKDAPENIDELLDSAVENEVKKFIASHGDNYALAQEAIAEQGMDWRQYREFQKKMLLTRQYYVSQSLLEDKPISHSQMLEYYEAMQQKGFQFTRLLSREDVIWEGFTEFRLIDIKLDNDKMEVGDGETRKDAAIRKAAELIDRIKQGEDFGELAKVYSDGHRKEMGGLWTRVSEGSSLNPPHHVLPPLAEKMEVGEVVGPVESDGHIFIMKLEDKKKSGVASFEDLQPRIEQEIQMSRRKVRFDKLIGKLMNRANISGLDRFIDVCVEKVWSQRQATGSLSSK
ncbi:MAG: peptidylprolyl isomerase [Planctomycetes bacterium]|nr:peptidylprolyl isomerase [Planctomycetota bacterium]